ncbi:hypothetical protein OG985_33925 [Streptomyces sp. NBC_00289]|uniref:hypothetical protein n=1 Tax=Streptomyces sp. NBC_00289 TaxID=2975703 RepID=UPI0032481B58
MGIRMLHRRTAQARTHAQANADATPSMPRPPVPVFAADASTARVPAGPLTAPRQAATALRDRLAPARDAVRLHAAVDWRLWAELGRGCLTLALARLARLAPLSRPRPAAGVTVFVAPGTDAPAADPLSGDSDGSAPGRPRPKRPGPGPDATS